LLEEDWDEKLIPRPSAITRSGGDVELVALAFAVADRIEASPGELLVWRGAEGGERVRPTLDPWAGGVIEQPERRRVPDHAVLKRLGSSGIASAGGDVSTALRAAYDGLRRTAR